MTTVIVWVLFVFQSPADRIPSPGIFSYASQAECEAASGSWKRYACVKVEVPKPTK